MSYEEKVRKKHRFEASVGEFFKHTGLMTIQEIELSIGRVADRSLENIADNQKHNLLIKGLILQQYLECRKLGIVSQRKIKRKFHNNEMKQFFAMLGKEKYELATYEYHQEIELRKIEYHEWWEQYENDFENWKNEIKQIPLLKRLFFIGKTPDKPAKPVYYEPSPPRKQEDYIELSLQSASMPEYLIEYATRFWLECVPSELNCYHNSDIKLLSEI